MVLAKKQFRSTPVRNALLKIFADGSLLSVPGLQDTLKELGLKPNKTTLYREIEFLKMNNLVQEVEFGDGKKRYETTTGPHHHHLVCVNCDKIEDVVLQRDVHAFEKKVERTKQFKVLRHSLEFFGLCRVCQ